MDNSDHLVCCKYWISLYWMDGRLLSLGKFGKAVSAPHLTPQQIKDKKNRRPLCLCVSLFVHLSLDLHVYVSLSEWVQARSKCLEFRYRWFEAPSIFGKGMSKSYILSKVGDKMILCVVTCASWLLLSWQMQEDDIQEIKEEEESLKFYMDSKVIVNFHQIMNSFWSSCLWWSSTSKLFFQSLIFLLKCNALWLFVGYI